MNEWLVITVDHEIWYSGSHNACYMWIKKMIKPEYQDDFYIIPSSLCEKYGVDTICDKLVEFYS